MREFSTLRLDYYRFIFDSSVADAKHRMRPGSAEGNVMLLVLLLLSGETKVALKFHSSRA